MRRIKLEALIPRFLPNAAQSEQIEVSDHYASD